MKVFVSSVIDGYAGFRDAAGDAIEALGHQPLRAESLPASATTPQRACLALAREADVVLLLLGSSYGAVQQPSGLSATHEEFRETRDRKPILVFTEQGVDPEARQQDFLAEVEGWATGRFRVAYSKPEDLNRAVLRALHDFELASSAGAADEVEMRDRARAQLPDSRGLGGSARLAISVAAGPHQQVIRPAELEDPQLARDLQQEALFGASALLDASDGTQVDVRGDALTLEQRNRAIRVDQSGSMLVILPASRDGRRSSGIAALVEEEINDLLVRSLRFTGGFLDRVDPLHRLTDVVVVACLLGAGYMPWRTQAEHDANPERALMGSGGEDVTVMLTPIGRPRQALLHDVDRIAEDLTVLLRRERAQ